MSTAPRSPAHSVWLNPGEALPGASRSYLDTLGCEHFAERGLFGQDELACHVPLGKS